MPYVAYAIADFFSFYKQSSLAPLISPTSKSFVMSVKEYLKTECSTYLLITHLYTDILQTEVFP